MKMRDRFAAELCCAASAGAEITLCVGDIGNRLFDDYKNNENGDFINCGIAEANMVSFASAIAKFSSSRKVFVYTITPFLITRAFEQIKLDVSYMNAPVTLVGTGSGLSYSRLGPTHHSFDDYGALSLYSNIEIYVPASPSDVGEIVTRRLTSDSPAYLRLGKKGEEELPKFHSSSPCGDFRVISKITSKLASVDLAIVVVGPLIAEYYDIEQDIYNASGVGCALISVRRIDDLIFPDLREFLMPYRSIVFIEEHYRTGSLFQRYTSHLISMDAFASRQIRARFIGVDSKHYSGLGERPRAIRELGLDKGSVRDSILKWL